MNSWGGGAMPDGATKDNKEFSNDMAKVKLVGASSNFKEAADDDCMCGDGDLNKKPVLVSREFQKSRELFSDNIIGTIVQRLEAVPQLDGTYDIYFRNKLFYDKGRKCITHTNPLHVWNEYNGIDVATKYPSSSGFIFEEVKALFCEYERSCQCDKPLPMSSLDQQSYWFRPLKFLDAGCLCRGAFDSQNILKAFYDFNYSKIGPLLGRTSFPQVVSQ